MSSFLIFALAFLLGALPSSARHVISINSSSFLELSSLAWDPIARYFLAVSTSSPVVYAIPDAGTLKCLRLDSSFNNSNVSATAVAVDHIRQRLIVALSNHSSLVAYDLKSYKKIFTVPLPELDGAPGGVVVDFESGDVFVSSASRGVVLKVGSEKTQRKVISEFKIPNDQGLGGLVHTSHGYIITVQPTTTKLFKVDPKTGTVKEILSRDGTKPLTPVGSNIIALRTNLSIVVTDNETLRSVESTDVAWERAAFTDKMTELDDDGLTSIVAVAMRNGTAYALFKLEEGYRIEEVPWGEHGPSQALIWLTVALTGLYVILFLWNMWMRARNQGQGCY